MIELTNKEVTKLERCATPGRKLETMIAILVTREAQELVDALRYQEVEFARGLMSDNSILWCLATTIMYLIEGVEV